MRPKLTVRAGPIVRISPDVKLSIRRLPYLARILEPRSRPFARQWRPSPLWDTASTPRRRGRPAMGDTFDGWRTGHHILPDHGPNRPDCPSWPSMVHCGTLRGHPMPGRTPQKGRRPQTQGTSPSQPPPPNWDSDNSSARTHALKRASSPDTEAPSSHPPTGSIPQPGAPGTPQHGGRIEILPYRLRAAGVCSRGLLPLPTLGLNDPSGTDCPLGKAGYPGTLLASDSPRRSSRG